MKNTKTYLALAFIVVDFFLFLYALSLIIIGVYVVIDHGIMLEITNGSIYLTGIYFLIFCGLILIFGVILGLIGMLRKDRFLIIAFIVLMILVFIISFIGSILLLAFKGSINDAAMDTMKDTLKNHYFRIRLYTDAWDTTQSRLRCCGVEDRSWSLYQDSYWDRNTNVDMNSRETKIPSYNTFYKFVPESCCWNLIDPQTGWPSNLTRNLHQCQQWQFGPPNKKDGPQNDAIYYRGCANALQSFIGMYASGIGALSFIYLIIIILGIILAVLALLRSSRKNKQEKTQYTTAASVPNEQSEYYPQTSQVAGSDQQSDIPPPTDDGSYYENLGSRSRQNRNAPRRPGRQTSPEFMDPSRRNLLRSGDEEL